MSFFYENDIQILQELQIQLYLKGERKPLKIDV